MLLEEGSGGGILMDGALFQGVLLGLVALVVILLGALLATLGGIRKALEERAFQSAGGLEAGSGSATAVGEALPGAGSSPAATEAGEAGARTGRAATIRGVLEQHGLQGSQQAAQAATGAAATQQPSPETATDSAFAAHADDPQEEPFQRDGRWWFRRGDDLLLYDEATGQWQPTPAEAPAAGAASGRGAASAPAHTQTVVAGAAQASPDVADQVATYWKCPTCGAVNGSTAATCRMCFAARP